ncbi:transcription factor GTE8 isoform X1 [Cucurbita pepo subsp. pepo]|uniref:transcription factor GTE8 isoform X1 n=2 Tax=Cucurbita pepo subsp. pepo TaxID=3664 RepID=UPI000C9D688A|nr:transcription factor GTE8 isoform X1 [Cucurbita pepo subsp. pepo]XP_023530518.1 transcription factor GTE8 isoform X1 [Cucurbita pepo subsp. pepo]XP_023530519.1 transcription factor GTE8 isoform X1 [Cucurbita pepo subsp. pepo]XP_023530520.1 transcription factor GTE8 isoform X1 [Cucurbita pepo subsp. pepo]
MDMRTEKNIRYPERYYGHSSFRTGESEGSGSSGRIDPEIAASEVSSTPMRRCISFNSESCEGLRVPTRVLPLTNLLQSERKDLIYRLRKELEQIQTLGKRVELLRTNSFTVSSSSDILSCSNGRDGPSAEYIMNTSNLTSGKQKKSNVPSQKKGQGSRQVASGRVESTVQASVSNSTNATSAALMKQCEQLLKRLMSHQYAWVFNTPVDVVKLNLPDYFTVIKHPMDLGTVKSKLSSGAYSSPLDFLADVKLTFSNAMTYNPPGNDVHIMADVLNSYFDMRWKAIEKKLPKTDGHALPSKSRPREAVETVKHTPQKKMKVASRPQEVTPMPTKRVMTDEEKLNLGRELESLLGELPMHIIDFLREYSSGGRESGEEDFEVNIDDLSDDTLFKLRKLLDDHFQEKQKNNAGAEPCVIELQMLNDSGVSNSSMQPSKGSGPIDEDMNVGGHEAPVSSCAPSEIEKGAANSKCAVSRNSKDSDISSYENDSECDKASIRVHEQQVPETIGSEGPMIEATTSDGPLERNQFEGGYEQLEQTSGKPSSTESDCNQDGNYSDKRVSPERLYRAALLKNRFADTILRAKEKTMTQGDKGDPEKLRREREELELEQRKEKARLQAEAKAAQDAQRRAEAEAAAEAKRKRELDREAARQALLQIEKTVIIDENSQFLEDWEMLKAAPTEQLPSSVDETSPDHSQDGLGSFKFVGSNPLEQLGLFIKADEEDEEIEPNYISSNAIKDVEEGEID